MGASHTRQDEEAKGVETINCGSHISVADIQRVAKEKGISESSKKVFRRAAMLVARCEDYIMKDCEMRLVDGIDLYIIFYAGAGGNNYVVLTNESDQAEDVCKKRSFSRVLREGAFSVFTSAVGWLGSCLKIAGGMAVEVVVRKALKM